MYVCYKTLFSIEIHIIHCTICILLLILRNTICILSHSINSNCTNYEKGGTFHYQRFSPFGATGKEHILIVLLVLFLFVAFRFLFYLCLQLLKNTK